MTKSNKKKGEDQMKKLALISALAAATALSACVETTDEFVTVPASGDPEAQARAACLRDVRATTGNPDVAVTSSEFSQAATRVVLQVGGTGTWQCFAYSDGTTDRIMSLTNEGAA